MAKYRFVGSVSDLGDGRTLEHGQEIELSAAEAQRLLEQHVALEVVETKGE